MTGPRHGDRPATAGPAAWLRRPLAAVLALLLLAGAVAYDARVVVREIDGIGGSLNVHTPDQAMADFRDTVYWPVRDLASGHDPYDPRGYRERRPVAQELDLYAPAHLALHAPFAVPPYRVAEGLWFAVLVCLVVAFGAVVLRALDLPVLPATVAALGAALLLTEPGQAAVYVGQLDPETVLGCALAIVWARTRPGIAAAGLALAMLKPQFGVPLAILLLARGATRPVLRGVAIAAAVSLPVVVLLVRAAGGIGGFADDLRANVAFATRTSYGDLVSPTGSRTDPLALAGRLTGWRAPGWAQVVLFAVVIGVTAWLVRRLPDGDPLVYALVPLGVLCSGVHAPADAMLLALPLLALGAGRGRLPSHRRWLLAGLLAVPFLYAFRVESWVRSGFGTLAAGAVPGLAITGALLVAWWCAALRRAEP
jgi:hypothetical protein